MTRRAGVGHGSLPNKASLKFAYLYVGYEASKFAWYFNIQDRESDHAPSSFHRIQMHLFLH